MIIPLPLSIFAITSIPNMSSPIINQFLVLRRQSVHFIQLQKYKNNQLKNNLRNLILNLKTFIKGKALRKLELNKLMKINFWPNLNSIYLISNLLE